MCLQPGGYTRGIEKLYSLSKLSCGKSYTLSHVADVTSHYWTINFTPHANIHQHRNHLRDRTHHFDRVTCEEILIPPRQRYQEHKVYHTA